MNNKVCTKCGEEKPATREYFYAERGNRDGMRGACKVCDLEYNKQYRQANKEKIAEYNKQYHQANKEKIAEKKKQYYQANQEKILEHKKQYYQANSEKIAESGKQYYQENKEKIAERGKQYYQANKEKIAERDKQYRQANKEKIAEWYKQYYQANQEKILEYNKQYNNNLPAGIYQIINKHNERVYIGCSTALQRRFAQHRLRLRKNKHDNKHLQEDYNKYGLDAFEFKVVEGYDCDTPFEILEKREQTLILESHLNGKEVYNINVKIGGLNNG